MTLRAMHAVLSASTFCAAAAGLLPLVLAGIASVADAQNDDLPGRVGRLADFAGQVLSSSQDRPDEWEPISRLTIGRWMS